MRRHANEEHKSRRGLRLLLKLTLGSFLLGILIIGIGLLYLARTPLPTADSDRNSKLLDAHGDVLATFSSNAKNRTGVKLEQISPYLIQATLAVEDRNFYHHIGFDLRGMARAALVNVERLDKAQGASTLTQQLARNLYLNHERTWTRKLKEAMYSAQLEMKYSKNEILQMYLNEIYYGHGAYGIEAAAQMYFGKSAKSLTLGESALLAGVPKGPTYYSPYNSMKNAKDRQKTVLGTMVDTQNITRQEANAAYAQLLDIKPLSQRTAVDEAPYFRDYIRTVVVNQLGIDENLLDHGGLTIYSTLDRQAQQAAENAVTANAASSPDLEAALISIDPRTGYVKAYVGGTSYTNNQYNHVMARTRQPGSSFKPIMYLSALSSLKMTEASVFKSEPTMFHYDNNRKTYSPRNYGEKYLGEIDMRHAIAASDNIYAVNTLMTVGAENIIQMARNMGIDSPMEPVPSLALGTSPVSPFEMASAFAVISNQGKSVKPVSILKITDASGDTLYQNPPLPSTPQQIVSPAAAYVMTHLMESVFETGGTGNRVSSVMKRPVAGKTGTTNTDAWLVGFTPELSTAVWIGYDKGKALATAESRKAAPIFAAFTEKALEQVPPKIFPIPDGVVSVYVDPDSGKLATADCPIKQLEVFIKGTEPKELCTLHTHGKPEPIPGEPPVNPNHGWWSDLKRWWMNKQ
ncbi:1A family penicillin-binding protein [Paenibacillus shirakamiensis]|uniref:1A family penicillin-binding protein n=1 Tax=Paenibacillus shirakamiensis TaxID=1265935 RepID=A0ABS4JM27_9BACL|nr:PBP1A family penicillin-binding protein [Paenibacillus shirakamiensis]MBP2002759.1 1A family penicillin-binding protein [Paenibacillus shirakamiensis]